MTEGKQLQEELQMELIILLDKNLLILPVASQASWFS
jgi:hypothetical protein